MSDSGALPQPVAPLFPREPLPTEGGDEGVQLLTAVEAVPATLRQLFEHEPLLGPEVLEGVQRTLESVEQRLDRKDLRVVVVGERRSGKSTLLDAIVGDRLLGGARGDLEVVTFLRRCDVPSYRARFASGKEDDFGARVPDKAHEIDLAVQALSLELAHAQRTCHELRLELRRAMESHGQAELEVERAFGDVRQARDVAEGAGSEVSAAENDAARVEQALAVLKSAIPASVRSTPPRWAFWLWLWRALFVLFQRARWLRYGALLRESEQVRARLTLERDKAATAAAATAVAEARFQPLDDGAAQARLHSSELDDTLRQAEAERDRLRSERDALRSEREHWVSERWRRFFTDLTALAKKKDLVELAIDYPAKLLPEDVTIVDIPGMLTDDSPGWELIRNQADGCILVSELDRAVSQATKVFLRRLRDVVPHVLLVLTKMDQAYERMVARGEEDPWGQVEHARGIGTRRFARELGRAPDRVLSVSVAAEALLSDRSSELAARSERELDKLFVLLRRERALILGAHAARAIRRCIAGAAEAETRAERAYRERILELEQQRTPEPAVFRQQILAQSAAAVGEAATRAVEEARGALADGFRVLGGLCEQTFAEDTKRKEYVARAGELARNLSTEAGTARADAGLALERGIERGIVAIERELFEALRARYQLIHEVRRATSSLPRLDAPELEHPSFAAVADGVRTSVARFTQTRLLLGASGAAAGAASGFMLHPWAGPLAGATLGGLLSFFRRQSSLRGKVLGRFRVALEAQERAYAAELVALEPGASSAIHQALERSLERAMIRFARYIAEPLEAERQLIEAERAKLTALEELRDRLSEHDQELERVLEAARRASVGLCRTSIH